MSTTHEGNVQPQLDYEEHEGDVNAKRFYSILGATAIASNVSISTTPTTVIPSNVNRLSFLIRNISNTTIFLSFTSIMSISTMYLRQNDVLESNSYQGPIFSTVGAGTGELRFIEERK